MSDSHIYLRDFTIPTPVREEITSPLEEKWWPSYQPTSNHMFHFLKSPFINFINSMRKWYYKIRKKKKSRNMRMINNEDIKEQN